MPTENPSVSSYYLYKELFSRELILILDDEIKTIAVGAGSGSRVLNGSKADLVVTGEFSHHEILGETHRGVSVIVTDHSNTERFYLKHFKSRFEQLLGKYNESIDIHVSETDRDPLEYI